MKVKVITIALGILFIPHAVSALQIQDYVFGNGGNGMTAKSYLVLDRQSGAVLMSKEPAKAWVPASLTKLMTALVVLDYNPKLTGNVSMIKADEVGGARLYTASGVSYKAKDLFYAMLVASANNAANAVSRGTGLSRAQFVEAMNKKAKELGALNTTFVDPAGISEKNKSTAEDLARIAAAAFDKPEVIKAAELKEFSMQSVSNKKYVHNLKTTNQLLGDPSINIAAGKTGYLNESLYNFIGFLKDQFGQPQLVVLLGADNPQAQFRETKQLAFLGGLAKTLFSFNNLVLGTSTVLSVAR